jgi:hypothetical protein
MKRFIKDLFFVLTKGLWQIWCIQREISKMDAKIAKMEKEIGPNATFLHYFEQGMEHNPEYVCQDILQSYLDSASKEDKEEENWQAIVSYAKQYDCFI